MKTKKGILTLLLVFGLCLGFTVTAFAHQLVIEPLGGTYVSFCYSDNTPCKGAKIIVKDASGNTIGSGKTTSKGIYNYAEFEGQAAVIVMNDGEGHMGEYEVPAETPPVTDKTPVEETTAAADSSEAETTAEAAPAATESAPAPAEPAPAEKESGVNAGTVVAIVLAVVAVGAVGFLAVKRSQKK